MNTCDQCKWWGFSEDGKEINDPFNEQHRICYFIQGERSMSLSQPRLNDITVTPYSHKKISTGPYFGCVHFESKQ